MSASLHGSIDKEQRAGCVPTDRARTEVIGEEEKEETAACVHDSTGPRLVGGLQVAQLSQSDSSHTDSTSQRNLCARKNFFTT